MKTKFKALAIALALVTFTSTSLIPRPAHAAVGGAIAIFGGTGIPLMIIGGSAVVAGSGGVIYALNVKDCGLGCSLAGFIGLGIGILGLVALDDSHHQDLAFTELSDAQAAHLGLNDTQMNAYNGELDEINAIRQEVASRLLLAEQPSTELAAAAWSEMKDQISADAAQAVAKVAQAFMQPVVQH